VELALYLKKEREIAAAERQLTEAKAGGADEEILDQLRAHIVDLKVGAI
jgi:hypothetical protein